MVIVKLASTSSRNIHPESLPIVMHITIYLENAQRVHDIHPYTHKYQMKELNQYIPVILHLKCIQKTTH